MAQLKKRLIILSSLSGAGQTTAIETFKDLGFICIDLFSEDLIDTFLSIVETNLDTNYVLSVTSIGPLQKLLERFEKKKPVFLIHYKIKTIFLEAESSVLINRYSLTRRKHPFSKDGANVMQAIEKEISFFKEWKPLFEEIVDTTKMNPHQLKRHIEGILDRLEDPRRQLHIGLFSFGFKHGLPVDVDYIFDVRFIKNPFFENNLKDKDGLHPKVMEYVLSQTATQELQEHLINLLDFCLPRIYEEGKHYLKVGIGCNGGKHRSVAIVENLCKTLSGRFKKDAHFIFEVYHRDLFQ